MYQAPIKKIRFTIVCGSFKEEYEGTYEVEEGMTWAEFFSTHNPEQYDSNIGSMVSGWHYRLSDGAIALWEGVSSYATYISMSILVNPEDKAIQYKDAEIKARYVFDY